MQFLHLQMYNRLRYYAIMYLWYIRITLVLFYVYFLKLVHTKVDMATMKKSSGIRQNGYTKRTLCIRFIIENKNESEQTLDQVEYHWDYEARE